MLGRCILVDHLDGLGCKASASTVEGEGGGGPISTPDSHTRDIHKWHSSGYPAIQVDSPPLLPCHCYPAIATLSLLPCHSNDYPAIPVATLPFQWLLCHSSGYSAILGVTLPLLPCYSSGYPAIATLPFQRLPGHCYPAIATLPFQRLPGHCYPAIATLPLLPCHCYPAILMATPPF